MVFFDLWYVPGQGDDYGRFPLQLADYHRYQTSLQTLATGQTCACQNYHRQSELREKLKVLRAEGASDGH